MNEATEEIKSFCPPWLPSLTSVEIPVWVYPRIDAAKETNGMAAASFRRAARWKKKTSASSP
jgi:hypothetical protein